MYVCPFRILIDRNERPAYDFKFMVSDITSPGQGANMFVMTRRVVLANGDYSIDGYHDKVTVERKTLGDFVSSVSSRHKNFEVDIESMDRRLDASAVIVEDTLPAAIAKSRTKNTGKTIFRTVLAWTIRYPSVHWFFMRDRRQAEICTFRFLERWYKVNVTGESE